MALKPMLAETLEDVTALQYPVMVSPKLDGIRCLIRDGVALSRSLKPIPNLFVQKWAKECGPLLNGLDGELIIGEHDEQVFARTTSGVMSIDGEPDFTYWAFDYWYTPEASYRGRLGVVKELTEGTSRCRVVPTTTAQNEHMLAEYERRCLEKGFEGVMIRHPDGLYKHGRSTLKQGWLLKLKQFKDAEATVVGTEELMHNANAARTNEVGATERSTCQSGMQPAGVLGALVVRSAEGVEFRIGSGFDAAERAGLWATRETLVGKLVKYRYFPQGVKDKPRFPTFIGWRHADDV